MAVNYEPFGVYVVIELDGRIVVVNENGVNHLPFSYGKRGETPQKCAKRIIETITSISPRFIKSLSFIERKAVDSISKEIKNGWPDGALTIPIYAFSFVPDMALNSLLSGYSLEEKSDVEKDLTEMESRVIKAYSL